MTLLKKLQNPDLEKRILTKVMMLAEEISDRMGRRPVLMEVCGTHTVNISQLGLRSLWKDYLELRSGPGCPVCVTDQRDLDLAVEFSRQPGVVIGTFGDMVRVPGSISSLEEQRAREASVRVFYSPEDALDLARDIPEQQVVFLGVGFETTTPMTAVALLQARKQGISNFSMLSLHKLVPPALAALLEDPEVTLDGLLLPGHVSAITGREAFDFIASRYKIPAAVTGFEAFDILSSIYLLLKKIEEKMPLVINGYPRAVLEKGNQKAKAVVEKCFQVTLASWRGLGEIPASGLQLREQFADFDACRKFQVTVPEPKVDEGCRCGDVLKGKIFPEDCFSYGRACTPHSPLGPCMVSSEGACAAYFLYAGKGRDRA